MPHTILPASCKYVNPITSCYPLDRDPERTQVDSFLDEEYKKFSRSTARPCDTALRVCQSQSMESVPASSWKKTCVLVLAGMVTLGVGTSVGLRVFQSKTTSMLSPSDVLSSPSYWKNRVKNVSDDQQHLGTHIKHLDSIEINMDDEHWIIDESLVGPSNPHGENKLGNLDEYWPASPSIPVDKSLVGPPDVRDSHKKFLMVLERNQNPSRIDTPRVIKSSKRSHDNEDTLLPLGEVLGDHPVIDESLAVGPQYLHHDEKTSSTMPTTRRWVQRWLQWPMSGRCSGNG